MYRDHYWHFQKCIWELKKKKTEEFDAMWMDVVEKENLIENV